MLIDYELVCNVLLTSIFSLDCACLCSAAWSEPDFMVVGVSKAITILSVEWGLLCAWSRHKLRLQHPRCGGHPLYCCYLCAGWGCEEEFGELMKQLRLCGKLEGSVWGASIQIQASVHP